MKLAHNRQSQYVVVQCFLFYSLKHSVMEPRVCDCAEVTETPHGANLQRWSASHTQ